MKLFTAAAALLTTAALTASACGGSTVATSSSPEAATTVTGVPAPERRAEPVDRLVAIDQGRLHIRCAGDGDSTVLLLAGWGDPGDNWGAIEPQLTERARVCSYARFGTGRSDAAVAPQTFATQAADLHALLQEADEPGPYVVLGHSFGGAEAVTFASQYPAEVAGLVLLDASPTTWPATVCSVPAYSTLCAAMRDPGLHPERLDAFPAFEAVAAITSLGDLPMTVVTAAHRTAPELAPAERTRLDAVWGNGVRRWAALSTSSSVVTVDDSGHYVQVDQPSVVIDAVTQLLP